MACLGTMAVWLGGFTFYAGVVVPILHDEFDSITGSAVTRRATDALNLIGLATVTLWWSWAWFGDRSGPASWLRGRSVLLCFSSASLIALIVLHEHMDRMLDATGLSGFYPWHRAYLMISTAQWAANLGLITSAVRLMASRSGAIGTTTDGFPSFGERFDSDQHPNALPTPGLGPEAERPSP
jgi:hypothetical protein